MIKIVMELECNEDTFNVNMGRIDKYATDETEKEIGKKYFDKLKEIIKNIDIDSLVKECLKDSKKDCKKSLDDLIDLMFNNKEISSKIINEKELDKLVDEILNNDKELKNIGKEAIKKILDEIMEED
jgi:hypothetical protein